MSRRRKRREKRVPDNPYKVKRCRTGRQPFRWELELIEKAGYVTRNFYVCRYGFGDTSDIDKPITSCDSWYVFRSVPDEEYILIGDDKHDPTILAICTR